jgi:hypothetical protein
MTSPLASTMAEPQARPPAARPIRVLGYCL